MARSWRAAISSMLGRQLFAEKAGITYNGKRDLFKALGYKKHLTAKDFRDRFNRNGVANRIVKAMPDATWRGGFELIEDEDPTTETAFETAWNAFNERLKVNTKLRQGDILSGIGQFGVLVIGAPGETIEPLLSCKAEDITYMMAYSQEEVSVFKWDLDQKSNRYGQPELYTIARILAPTLGNVNANVSLSKQVHWTRIVHLADGLLDDLCFGEPRLEAVWNDIDDLEKVKGGGAEAYWRRADGGTQFDLDPELELEGEEDDSPDTSTPTPSGTTSGMKKQIEEMEHGLRRYILTRGVKVNRMGSDVAGIKDPIDTIFMVISAATGIPKRVLSGTEEAKQAGMADRSNWDDRVSARRDDYAGPMVVRPLVDRLIGLGALPAPKVKYQIRWSDIRTMDDMQRAEIAAEWAALNRPNGPLVVMPDEIRERILQLGPLAEAGDASAITMMPSSKPQGGVPAPFAARKFGLLSFQQKKSFLAAIRIAAEQGKEQPRWTNIHRAADRFRSEDQIADETRLRNRARRLGPNGIVSRAERQG